MNDLEKFATDTLLPNLDSVSAKHKQNREKLLSHLIAIHWTPGLTEESYRRIIECNFRLNNSTLAAITAEIAVNEQPLTLRGLFYQVVSSGFFPSTDDQHYRRLGRIVSTLRKRGVINYRWIIDNMRSTEKPSSWSGLADFADTVRDAYRKNFWQHLPNYVHVFCEKDAISGTVAPVTRELDVCLSPIRGYCSESFAFEVGNAWKQIEKPIFGYYLGDYDPSGFDIERSLKEKVFQHAGSDAEIHWQRLAVNQNDFDEFDLIRLKPKKSDRRYKKFAAKHGDYCAEVDAIPATELRRRVRSAIMQHVPQDEWNRLLAVENAERESFQTNLENVA